MSTALTSVEQASLIACEKVISTSMKSFVEVGEALMAIRTDKLYRAEYETFEDYCQGRWNWTRQRAHQLIDAARVVNEIADQDPNALSTMVDKMGERAVRELKPLAPKERGEVLEQVEKSGKKPTASSIREAKGSLPRPASFGTPATDFSDDIEDMNKKPKRRNGAAFDAAKAESVFGQLRRILFNAGLEDECGEALEVIARAIKKGKR